MTLGSLFDGAGTCPFAAQICGIKPVWASEIEPFPVAVTTKRFPEMKHLGDITKIDGAEIEPVDIITFGSPCQDLSVAGKRAGLDGERSGLFMEAVRIIKEMRSKTDGRYPRIAVWENVPGAFSSNKGEDFRVVLEELCKVKDCNAVIPRPPKGKWSDAGEIVGDGYSLAWRVLDAQYWGVPQRRRRIFLVADFRGERAGEILFERKGLSRNFAESRKAWKGITKSLAFGVGDKSISREYGISSYASNAMKSPNPHSGVYEADTARTLDQNGGNPACNQGGIAIAEVKREGKERDFVRCVNLNKDDVQSKAIIDPSGVAPSLYAGECRGGGGELYTLYLLESECIDAINECADHQQDLVQGIRGKARTLAAGTHGAGGHLTTVFAIENHPADSRVELSNDNTVQTLTSRMGTGGGNIPYMLAFACNQRDEARDVGDKATAIQAQPGMKQQTFLAVFDARGNGNGEICPNITGDHENRITDYTAVICGINWDGSQLSPTLSRSNANGSQRMPDKENFNAVLVVRKRCGCEGGGKGCLIQENVSGAIATGNDQFLCVATQQGGAEILKNLCPTITSAAYNQGKNAQFDIGVDDSGTAHTVVAKGPGAVCYAVDMGGGKSSCNVTENVSPTLTCTHYGEPVTLYLVPCDIILRRLTPTECARLQGMPDWWCDDVPHSDSAEYKMWGNGMALPNVLYIMESISEYLKDNTDE